MGAGERASRITVDLGDSDLHRSLRHAAVDAGRPLREIVIAALREWLERYEDEAAARLIDAAQREVADGRDELVAWEEARERLPSSRQRS